MHSSSLIALSYTCGTEQTTVIRFMGRAVDGKADKKLGKFPDREFQLTEMASKWLDINVRKLRRSE